MMPGILSKSSSKLITRDMLAACITVIVTASVKLVWTFMNFLNVSQFSLKMLPVTWAIRILEKGNGLSKFYCELGFLVLYRVKVTTSPVKSRFISQKDFPL